MGLEAGARVGDYEVVAVLGAGGMGQVYKVRNIISERIEAMKVLLPSLEGDQELIDRFLREIKVQATLEHPNIAALRTAMRIDNQLLMVMEFVEGTTIEQLLGNGPLALPDAVNYTSQVLSALGYAHARGVIHRDIKPANMMLTPGGVVKLMDFGIAKMAADRRLTQTGRTVGSLFYMSPEQIRGATELDPRSDIYSLGVALYEMVTGRRPFQGDSDYSIMAAHLQQVPVPPIQLDPSMPSMLNEIILMAIAKDPAQRFQSADAFRAALGQVMGAAPPPKPMVEEGGTRKYEPAPPVVAQAAPMPPPPAKSGSRRGLYMVVGSLLTLGVFALAITQGPKFFGTKAGSRTPVTQVSNPATQPQQTQQPQTTAVQTTDTGTQSPNQPPANPGMIAATGGGRGATAQPASQDVTSAVKDSASGSQGRKLPVVPEQPRTQQTQPGRPVQEPPPQTRSQPVREAGTQQAVNPPALTTQAKDTAPAEDKAALNELRDQYNLLAIRAGAVKSGLDSMQAQMARQGVGLRGDIKETATRMDYLMQETMSYIRNGKAAEAKKSIDMADRAVETLEKFLGR